jgi:hypothetical protein
VNQRPVKFSMTAREFFSHVARSRQQDVSSNRRFSSDSTRAQGAPAADRIPDSSASRRVTHRETHTRARASRRMQKCIPVRTSARYRRDIALANKFRINSSLLYSAARPPPRGGGIEPECKLLSPHATLLAGKRKTRGTVRK